MNYSYEEFSVLSLEEKADVLLEEYAYRLFQKTKGATLEELVHMDMTVLRVIDKLNGIGEVDIF